MPFLFASIHTTYVFIKPVYQDYIYTFSYKKISVNRLEMVTYYYYIIVFLYKYISGSINNSK